jgi:hypothetical protein
MSKGSNNGGLGVLGVLEIIFIVLKCIGAINWSWWIVLIPLWIDLSVVALWVVLFLLSNHNTK